MEKKRGKGGREEEMERKKVHTPHKVGGRGVKRKGGRGKGRENGREQSAYPKLLSQLFRM